MIGGIDILLPTKAGNLSIIIAVRVIRLRWDHAVFANGLTGKHFDRFQEIPFGEIEELFVYRDRESADLWCEEGAIPEAYNRMIHLLLDDDLLAIVIDEDDAAMHELIEAIRSALSDEIHNNAAERVAA